MTCKDQTSKMESLSQEKGSILPAVQVQPLSQTPPRNFIWEYLPALQEKMTVQLKNDQEKQGERWKDLPRVGQEERIFTILEDYYQQFKTGKGAIPWLKIIGLAHIAAVREAGIDDRPSEGGVQQKESEQRHHIWEYLPQTM